MKNWMIGLGSLAGVSALGCGGKFDVEREFVTSIDNKAAVVSQLQVEQVPGSEEVIDPKMTLCLEFTDFMVDQLVDVMEDTLTQVDACFQIDGIT